MKTVHLAQPNHSFGNNAFLPYSVATLWAYANPDPAEFQLARPMQFSREPFANIIEADPDVLALSCYIWNWEYNMALAAAVKADNPDCVVIIGGPQVTKESVDIPWIDHVVHGEGELAFSEILKRIAAGEGSHFEITAERTRDLEQFPSPYIEGHFKDIIEANPRLNFHALWETHRGCPYSCTFCDWGSATQAKVTTFSMERLREEITWFAQNKIELVYNCDANFGMLPRDEGLINDLIASKVTSGYPEKIRAAYPKIHNDRIVQQNIRLHKSGMAKGVTISLQSLDDSVLNSVKRKNIAIDDFEDLNKTYLSKGVPTYTELILGLPGETAETFLLGIDRLLQAGQHAGMAIYPCMVLPNSELNDPEYKKEFEITSKRVQQMLLHATPNEDNCQEYYEMVVQTSTMEFLSWRYMMIFSWFVQALHCLGLTRYIAQWRHEEFGEGYIDFYQDLLDHAVRGSESSLKRIYLILDRKINQILEGESWDMIDHRFGPISWPPEEFIHLINMEFPLLLMSDVSKSFRGGIPAHVIETQIQLLRHKRSDETVEDWAKETVWYGRKSGGTYAKTN
jgi:radical SAM superfamily enzyme YgiQ (UPF0313 family)